MNGTIGAENYEEEARGAENDDFARFPITHARRRRRSPVTTATCPLERNYFSRPTRSP